MAVLGCVISDNYRYFLSRRTKTPKTRSERRRRHRTNARFSRHHDGLGTSPEAVVFSALTCNLCCSPEPPLVFPVADVSRHRDATKVGTTPLIPP